MSVRSAEINPITKTDYPDPDIIRVGNVYYLVSTTMHFFPGGEILRSYDLVHWEIVTHLFRTLDGTDAERMENGKNIYGKGMWAASLRYHQGQFYVLFVSHGQEDTHVFISKRFEGKAIPTADKQAELLLGAWEHRRIKGYYHDASLLFDDDGRIFLTYGNMQIHLTELAPDLSGPKEGGIDRIIIRDNPEEVFLGYEGSHFYKIDGKYYVALIHWPKSTSRRTEAIFVSDTVDGEYTGRDVCCDDMGFHNQGVAQGGLVQTPKGLWYSVMFRDSGAVGRVPVLVPVAWNNGFPVFGENGRIPEDFVTPNEGPEYEYEPLFTSDDFRSDEAGKYDSLKPQWQWNHVPDGDLWRICPEGGLAITTGKVCRNLVQARNTLTQRMQYPYCAGTVTIDASGIRDGDYAGLCVLQGCYGFIGIEKEGGRYFLVRIVKSKPAEGFGIGSNDCEPGEITKRIPLEKPVIRVKAEGFFEDMVDYARFYYEQNGQMLPLGGDHKLVFRLDHFTGARFGLCVFATRQPGGTAVFREFRYEQ